MTPRFKQQYDTEIAPALAAQLGLDNVMRVPRLEKIVVNMGVGEAAQDAKQIDGAVEELRVITGQHPKVAGQSEASWMGQTLTVTQQQLGRVSELAKGLQDGRNFACAPARDRTPDYCGAGQRRCGFRSREYRAGSSYRRGASDSCHASVPV